MFTGVAYKSMGEGLLVRVLMAQGMKSTPQIDDDS